MCKDGGLNKWKPNLAMVSATIRFAADIGKLNVKRDTEKKRREGSEPDDGDKSEDGEE